MSEEIEQLKKEVSYRNGWNSCGMMIVGIIEKYWDELPFNFIEEVKQIFST